MCLLMEVSVLTCVSFTTKTGKIWSLSLGSGKSPKAELNWKTTEDSKNLQHQDLAPNKLRALIVLPSTTSLLASRKREFKIYNFQ